MSTDRTEPTPQIVAVAIDDGHVHIHDLVVEGVLLELVERALDGGEEPELVVRRALDVGAAILLHGSAKGTVDAVAAEVDRLLTALGERAQRIEAVGRMRERIAAKGFGFEERLGPVLDACFAPHQDVVEATGTTKGIADDIAGDFVVILNPRDTGGSDRRIVFEAKDQKLSMARARAELDAAALNRNAHVAVLVFAHQAQAPLMGKPLRVFPGNRLMVVHDADAGDGSSLPLEVCTELARTLALGVEREDAKLNRRGARDRIDRLVNIVERAEDIKRGIAGARRGLDDAEDAYELMREEAFALLYELQDRI